MAYRFANDSALLRMFKKVGRQLRDSDGDVATIYLVHPYGRSTVQCRAPSLPRVGWINDLRYKLNSRSHSYFHRIAVTFVPSPTRDLTSNSLTSLLAPPKPSPNPEPVVNPSRRAKSISAMPGPLSSKTKRMPTRGPLRAANSICPPRPWISVLRASSLAAVTTFVWSTRLKPSFAALSRTQRRTVTTSASVTTGKVS